jgi:hypothetical protein
MGLGRVIHPVRTCIKYKVFCAQCQVHRYAIFVVTFLILSGCRNHVPDATIDLISPNEIVDGYVDKQSYLPGEVANVYINAKQTIHSMYIPVYSINGILVESFPADIEAQTIQHNEPWQDGYGYELPVSFTVSIQKPGVYLIGNKIPFIVKSPVPAEITIVYPSNTDNAYCLSGGRNLYTKPKADIVSFNRPMTMQDHSTGFLRWFDKLNISGTNFISDRDMDNYDEIQNSKLLVIIGHSEYWTRKARENFDKFVDSGRNILILSGNTMWWQVRYSEGMDQMICYKSDTLDPVTDPLLKTVNWAKPELQYPSILSIGCDWPHGGYGLKFPVPWKGYKILKPNSPIFDGISLKIGDMLSIPTGEFDGTYLTFKHNLFPAVDDSLLQFFQVELIGYGPAVQSTGAKTYGSFMAFQKTATSGIIINTASNDWCNATTFEGKDGAKIKKITLNMIFTLLNNSYVFTN